MGDYSALPTLTSVTKTVFGNKKVRIFSCTLDGSSTWPAAGLSLTPAMLGLRGVEYVSIQNNTSGVIFEYDYTNQVLNAYTAAAVPGTAVLMIKATGSAPANVPIQIFAFGYGDA